VPTTKAVNEYIDIIVKTTGFSPVFFEWKICRNDGVYPEAKNSISYTEI
jgi:hypothetical protein